MRPKNWSATKLVKDTAKKMFSDGIKKLVKSWNRRVEGEEHYAEKLC
jgi:hypothetical protein